MGSLRFLFGIACWVLKMELNNILLQWTPVLCSCNKFSFAINHSSYFSSPCLDFRAEVPTFGPTLKNFDIQDQRRQTLPQLWSWYASPSVPARRWVKNSTIFCFAGVEKFHNIFCTYLGILSRASLDRFVSIIPMQLCCPLLNCFQARLLIGLKGKRN